MNIFQGKLNRYSAGQVLDFGTGAGASARNVIDAVKDFECVIGVDTTRPEQDIEPDLFNHPRFRYIQLTCPPKTGPKLMLVLGLSGGTNNGKEKDIFNRTDHHEAA